MTKTMVLMQQQIHVYRIYMYNYQEKTGGPVFFILSKKIISPHTNGIFQMM